MCEGGQFSVYKKLLVFGVKFCTIPYCVLQYFRCVCNFEAMLWRGNIFVNCDMF